MDRMEVAKEAVKEAEKILMDRFNGVKNFKNKTQHDLVTDADIEAEKKIVGIIRKNFPDDVIWSEEAGKIEGSSDYTWFVDPLDGTNNFCYSIPFFGTQIALMKKEKVVFGLINIPHFKELYVAEKGKGAYCNNRRIEVSKRSLKESLMIHDSKFSVKKVGGEKEFIERFRKLANSVFAVRVYGVAVLDFTFVATGKADLYLSYIYKPMDILPGCLLIEEAGGKVTDFQGNPWKPHMKNIVASNGKIHEEVLKIIKL